MRHNLPNEDRLWLSFLHEYGHLQTLPIALLHVELLIQKSRRLHSMGEKLKTFMTALIAHQATWELAAEGTVCAKTGSEYHKNYNRYPNPVGQAVFWIGMAGLALLFTSQLVQGASTCAG